MLKNYFKLAWRSLFKHKLYSGISLLGLAVGMAVCLVILLFVQDELSYDQFHQKKDRIYRLLSHNALADVEFASTSGPLAPVLRERFSEMEEVARMFSRSAGISVLGDNKSQQDRFEEDNFHFADSSILNILSFDFLVGNPQYALSAPNSLVLNRTMAEKYFGQDWQTQSIIGRQIIVEGQFPFQVTGVFEDYPLNSHIAINFLASFENIYEMNGEQVGQNLRINWIYNPYQYFILLREGVTQETVEAKFPTFLKEHTPANYAENNDLSLQPLPEIYLYSDDIASSSGNYGDISILYVFAAIAIFTLLIACINFINLSTARSLKRAKEVGMRKVLGAQRFQLIGQFLSESTLLSFLALGSSFVLIYLFLPILNALTQKEISFSALSNPYILSGLFAIFLLTGLIAGSYPALFVSRFRPVLSLKGFVSEKGKGNLWLRRGLVVFQFCISITLIAASFVLFQQLDFLRNKPLGFDQEQLVAIPLFTANRNLLLGGGLTGELRGRMNTFEEELLRDPHFEAVSVTSHLPGLGAVYRNVVPDGFKREDNIYIANMAVDYDFIETAGLEVLAGRKFSKEFGTDHLNAFVLNESAIHQFGWQDPKEAIGKPLEREGKAGTVIGVLKDFHFSPLQQEISPLLMDVSPLLFRHFVIRLQNQEMANSMEHLENLWRTHFPERVFAYQFLDDRIDESYRQQERLGQITSYFAFLAIFISCLGLFGLASFSVAQRTKEIGIRKVLGASTTHIVRLLSREFILLVGVAFTIAVPITLYFMNGWLQDFAYRINISVWVFLVAGILALLIASLTVGYQSIRAAVANPIDSLREE